MLGDTEGGTDVVTRMGLIFEDNRQYYNCLQKITFKKVSVESMYLLNTATIEQLYSLFSVQ